MVTHQSISALEKSINDIIMETQDKTVDVCCDCLESLITDPQEFNIDQYTVNCCISMLQSLKHESRIKVNSDVDCNNQAE